MSDKFYDKAKDAGNSLKAYVLSIATGSTAVFFFTLTGKDVDHLSNVEKNLLIAAVTCFAVTVVMSLVELHIDAKRFYNIAVQLDKHQRDQDWSYNDWLKAIRLKILYFTYFSLSFGFLFTFVYMCLRII